MKSSEKQLQIKHKIEDLKTQFNLILLENSKLDNPIVLDVSFKIDSYFEENRFSNKNFKKLFPENKLFENISFI